MSRQPLVEPACVHLPVAHSVERKRNLVWIAHPARLGKRPLEVFARLRVFASYPQESEVRQELPLRDFVCGLLRQLQCDLQVGKCRIEFPR